MQYVFVLDNNQKPPDPCHPARARKLLSSAKAAVFRTYPFTIILKERKQEDAVVHEYRVKIDPGSQTTGLAVVSEGDNKGVVWAAEIQHRGQKIRANLLSRQAIRRGRRHRHCRYRPARFDNRRRKQGWLPPSLESRLANVQTWVSRLACSVPVTALALELVKFDTQALGTPRITGGEYQQGTLFGCEIREYLLEKWERKCASCGRTDVPLEIEQITPRSRGGSDRVSNLTLACHACNQIKASRTAAEFGHPGIQAKANAPLKDAAAVNSIRKELQRRLSELGIPVECGSGGRTKFNQTNQKFPKTHWLDAACVGDTGKMISVPVNLDALTIRAFGHGSRQMCRGNTFGFPRTKAKACKLVHGFQTGEIVRAGVLKDKKVGTYVGRVAVRSSGNFNIPIGTQVIQGIGWKYCESVHKPDGYSYMFKKGAGIPPLG